jgi:hypothetical protein
MKNVMFILLFIITSLFSATNSMAFNQNMEMNTDSMHMTMMERLWKNETGLWFYGTWHVSNDRLFWLW